MHLRVILYNQSPLWAEPGEFKDDISHRIVRRLTPRYRLTTSHQKGICIDGKIRERYAYFTPFVMGPACAPENKKYFQNGHINIMETGKYEKRKNHFMMVNVFEKLLPDYPEARLTIVGEAADRFQREYFDRLSEYISDHHLEEVIVLKKNLSRAEMGKEYQKADIFVLPSTGEPASVSIAEAMAYSIPVIGGTDNGTADYISDGITGAVFKDKDEKDLFDKMKAMLEDRTVIMNMGKAAYQDILDRFQFKDYYATICQIMSDQDRGV
jgi:glycosyltransferase involved in cell wall biosynthesis